MFNFLKKKVAVLKENEVFENKRHFKLSSVQKYHNNYKGLLKKNEAYDKMDLKTQGKVREYLPLETYNAQIVFDKNNAYSKNAMYLICEHLKLGYIKDEDIAEVQSLIKQKHRIRVEVFGGNFKEVKDGVIEEHERALTCRVEIQTK